MSRWHVRAWTVHRAKVDLVPGALAGGFVEPGRRERNVDPSFETVDQVLGDAGRAAGRTGQGSGQRADRVGRASGVDRGEDRAFEQVLGHGRGNGRRNGFERVNTRSCPVEDFGQGRVVAKELVEL